METRPLRILIACEFTGTVRREFERLGHDAWSCDLRRSEDGSNRHIVGDARDVVTWGWELNLPSERERFEGETAMRVRLVGETPAEIDEAYRSLRSNCGWPETPEREAFLAMEYAANHIEYKDEAGEFVADFVASDFADFLATWTAYATWRDERMGADRG